MKNQVSNLKIAIWFIIILAVTTLINDIIEFDFSKYTTFESWPLGDNDGKRWGLSQESIKYSFYIIEICLFAFKIYLIYGVTQLFYLIKNIENKLYFSQKNIDLFKKIGHIFITYVINVFILKAILSYVASGGHGFNFMQLLNNEIILLLAGGMAFYVLATIFERAKELQEENDLTV